MALVQVPKAETITHVENDLEEEVGFAWGRKRGVGGKKKVVQFYESFTYDGVEYSLYDCVYMYKEGELPYIGMLIKIWENPDKSKKVKVHWFFRPSEISFYLGDVNVAENEIFLATGEGVGLANVNSLEAIAGKCNVLCILEDTRNPQPSEEEVKMADYVFCRAFDVGKFIILDKINDNVGGLDALHFFNRKGSQKASQALKFSPDQKDDKTAVEFSVSKESVGVKPQTEGNHLLGRSVEAARSLPVRQDQRGSNALPVNQEASKKGNSALGEQKSLDHSDTGKAESDENTQSFLLRQDSLRGGGNDSSKQVSTMKGNPAPPKIVSGKAATVTHRKNNISDETARHKVNNAKDDKKVNKPSINQVDGGEKGKPPKVSDLLDNRPSKRMKVNGSVKLHEETAVNSVQKSIACRNEEKVLGTNAVPSEERKKSGDQVSAGGVDKNMNIKKDSAALDVKPLKKTNTYSQKVTEGRDKSGMAISKSVDSLGKLSKLTTGTSPKEVDKMQGKSFEVTQRPVAESSKWFKAPLWEEVMLTANEQGTLVLLENLNPEYTSGEVEDIIWHACRENCTAKMIQRTASSSPYSGRALVAFKTREAAERVTKKLDDGCLMLSNQRLLVSSFVSLPNMEGNLPSFAGHFCVDKLKLQLQREMKEAVSTSHCSQPNTIEYEMAIEWSLLQSRSDSWWSRLYKQQKEEIRKIAAGLKTK